MLIAIGFVVAFYLTAYISRPIITIFHELGHAFAHLIFSKPSNINVYIGSYGKNNNNLEFKIGKLCFYVTKGFPFINNGGACQSDFLEPNYFNEIIILLAGPFLSLGIACMAIFLAFHFETHGAIKFYVLSFAIWALISLISSLKPRTIKSVKLDTDGKQLLFTLRIRKAYTDYASAYNCMLQGRNTEAAEKLLSAVSTVQNEPKLLQLLASNLKLLKDFEKLEACLLLLNTVSSLSIDEHIDLGYCRSISHKHELAIESYNNALLLDPNNQFALNNLAYELIYSNDYDGAEKLLNQAIELDSEFSYSYSYLGYIKILSGQLEEGKQYVEMCIEKHPDDAYAYKHLGVYYLKIGEKDLAQTNFKKSIEIDPIVDLENYPVKAQNMP